VLEPNQPVCAVGGNTGSNSAVTEEYNGTSWSISNSLSTARAGLAGAGTQTAGLCMGGYTGSDSAITEEYDGTSWSRSGDLNTARRELAGCGTQSAGLCMGGYTNSAVTEEYTQPEGYDTTEEGNDVVEITQNGIITVACQPSVGETLSVIFDDGSRCIFLLSIPHPSF